MNNRAPNTHTLRLGADPDPLGLVAEWYRIWHQGTYADQPTPWEVRQARQVIDRYGWQTVVRALPILIQLQRERWATAVRWGSTISYWGAAVSAARRQGGDRGIATLADQIGGYLRR